MQRSVARSEIHGLQEQFASLCRRPSISINTTDKEENSIIVFKIIIFIPNYDLVITLITQRNDLLTFRHRLGRTKVKIVTRDLSIAEKFQMTYLKSALLCTFDFYFQAVGGTFPKLIPKNNSRGCIFFDVYLEQESGSLQ